jgi:hypothetical protein
MGEGRKKEKKSFVRNENHNSKKHVGRRAHIDPGKI